MTIEEWHVKDLPKMMEIWNEVVKDGEAFPQEEELILENSRDFFSAQSWCGVGKDENGELVGLYILHPNNIGRCGHIANASYAVARKARNGGIGKRLVQHSIKKARELGFGVLQFNAVVASNIFAIKLYEDLGFHCLGRIEKGFLNKKNEYEDIFIYWINVRA